MDMDRGPVYLTDASTLCRSKGGTTVESSGRLGNEMCKGRWWCKQRASLDRNDSRSHDDLVEVMICCC